MAWKFNPFTGNLDYTESITTTWKTPVADAASLPLVGNFDGDARVTLDTDEVWVWDAATSRWENQQIQVTSGIGSTPNAQGYSKSENTTNPNLRTNELVLQPADSSNPGIVSTAAQNFAGNKTFDNNVIITGDLTVNGTTTELSTTTVNIEDPNVTYNRGGNDASAEGAGITIERTGTDGSLVYEDALASKFKAGALGSEIELANVSSTQTITNKNLKSNTNLLTGAKTNNFELETGNEQVVTIPDTATPDNFVLEDFVQSLTNKSIDADQNSITNIDNADIKALAGIDATKIADGSVNNTEFQYINSLTSNAQNQLNDIMAKAPAKLIGGGDITWISSEIPGPTSNAYSQPTSNSLLFFNTGNWPFGQSFQSSVSGNLTTAQFWLRQGGGGSSGLVEAVIYAATSETAITGLPNGSGVLAVSTNTVDLSTIPTSASAFAAYNFTFASTPTLTAGNFYLIGIRDAGGATGGIQFQVSTSNPVSNGRVFYALNPTAWDTFSTYDITGTFTVQTAATITKELTFGSAAYISIPGEADIDNEISAQTIEILDGEAAYVDLNIGGGPSILTVNTAVIDTIAQDNKYIIARRDGDDVIVGDSMRLSNGETKKLYDIRQDVVIGPASATDNAIARFDLTTGKLIQNSTATIDDSGNLDVQGNITLTGTVDGVDVAALQSDVNGFPDELKNLTTTEIQQLENIDATTISTTQWGYLGALDQSLTQASAVTFLSSTIGALNIASNSIISTGVNQDIQISPNGTGNIDASTSKITNVVDPTSAQDAATKNYVDSFHVTGDIKQTSFSLAESQTGANVTGLAFANGVTRAAKVQYAIVINATASLYETGTLELLQTGSGWVINRTSIGDDTLIVFNVDGTGQVTYDSSIYAGFSSGEIKFKAETISI